MPILSLVLSYLLPCLLYIHATWRLFKAGSQGRMLLAFTPTIAFGLATIWLGNSVMRHWMGRSADEQLVHLTTSVGPIFFFFIALMVEVPFWSDRFVVHRRSKKAKAKAKTQGTVGTVGPDDITAVLPTQTNSAYPLNRAARRLLKRKKS